MTFLRIEGLTIEGRGPDGSWSPTASEVNLTIETGEVVALIGGSGAGKTTVALAAMGYTRPGTRIARGSVTIGGVDVLRLPLHLRRSMRGMTMAYVPQSAQAALNPAMRVGEQVEEPFLIHGVTPASGIHARAIELLDELDIPSPAAVSKRFPHQISGGQQQRVGLAMGLSCAAGLLILDEPTTALDVTTQIEVLKAIKTALRLSNSAAIYVSHDLALVAQLADRVIVMQSGRIIEEGVTADIIGNPQALYSRQLVDAFSMRLPKASVVVSPQYGAKPVLEIENVSATYDRPRLWNRKPAANVLHDISFNVEPGQIVAVIGESGSGKSTLGRVIAGLHPQSHGNVRFQGEAAAKHIGKRDKITQRGIQIVLQSPDLSLNPRQRIKEALGRPLQLYHGLSGPLKTARIAELLEFVGLPAAFSEKFPGDLSGGQRQRVSIARAFAAEPQLIICDEILSSLDALVATQIIDLIQSLRRKKDVSFLFISHDMNTVARIADVVVVMYGGKVCEIGRPADIFQAPHHPYTALLLSSVPTLDPEWLESTTTTAASTKYDAAAPGSSQAGCVFAMRCPVAVKGQCDTTPPPRRSTSANHALYCHRTMAELSERTDRPLPSANASK